MITIVYIPTINKKTVETSVRLFLLTKDILLLNENDSLLKILINDFAPEFVFYSVDINNPHTVDGKYMILPIDMNTFDISKLSSYIYKMQHLKIKTKNKPISVENKKYKLSSNLIEFYNILSMREYLTQMFINDRYTAEDIDNYNINIKADNNVMEFEGIVRSFYMFVNKENKTIESILENYQDKPYYLLQMLYKKYIDDKYELIKDVDAYSTELTIIV